MSTKALGDYTQYAKYSKYLESKQRREVWPEPVKRVMGMHRTWLGEEKAKLLSGYIEKAESAYSKKKVLGAQRALQFGGEPIIKNSGRTYNCSASYVEETNFFQNCMWLLLCGTGVGFSVQKHHINKLPDLTERSGDEITIKVADTIEGWSDAIGVLIRSYFNEDKDYIIHDGDINLGNISGKNITVDLSNIRPKGSPISWGGVAPGPGGLQNSLNKIKEVLDKASIRQDKRLKPIEAYDCIMHSSDAVLSGGIRRAATLCMFSHDDEEMLKAKTGDWFIKNPQRGRSNNSAVLLKGEVSKEEFHSLFESVQQYGEPGFIWVEDKEALYNPCFTGDTKVTCRENDVVTYKAIKDIRIGDVVKSFNHELNRFEWKKVTDWALTRKDAEIVCSDVVVGNVINPIRHTKEHKFYHQDKGQYLPSQVGATYYTESAVKAKCERVVELDYREDVYDITVEDNHNFFANGVLVHNCVEIGLYGRTEDGRTGFQMCNLTEINMGKVKTEEDFYLACEAASILGTIQASYTKFPYLKDATQEITEREALLGVSMTGMMDSPDIAFNPEIQRKGAEIVKAVNKEVAEIIGINQAARCTAVKPAGSTSVILGTASGIHPHHASRYIRNVQANKLEFPAQHFQKHNPVAVEESVWSNNGTDVVLSFMCEVPNGAKTKNDINALDLLNYVKLTQDNWVAEGKNHEHCAQPWLNHNVSNTIHVKDKEWLDVETFIYENRQSFAGVSLLSAAGDKDYPQAPFTAIYTPREMLKRYGECAPLASGLIVDGLKAFNNNLWAACDCALGQGENLKQSFLDLFFRSIPEGTYNYGCLLEMAKASISQDLKDDKALISHYVLNKASLDVISEICAIDAPNPPLKQGYGDSLWAKKLATYAAQLSAYHELEKERQILLAKADWDRRIKQFAERYLEGDVRNTTYLLKDTNNWKKWLDMGRTYKEIDWKDVIEEDETKIDVSTISGEACAGGKCELTIPEKVS